MPRSRKKLPYIHVSLYEKIVKAREDNSNRPIQTYKRASTILPMMVGMTFLVHNGRQFIEVHVTSDMVGHKLGEFSPTRTFKEHSGDRKK